MTSGCANDRRPQVRGDDHPTSVPAAYDGSMTDAQTWTALIGMMSLLAGAMAFSFNLISRTFLAEMRGGFAELRGEIRVIDTKVDALARRVDGLDADVQAITRRLMDGPDTA